MKKKKLQKKARKPQLWISWEMHFFFEPRLASGTFVPFIFAANNRTCRHLRPPCVS